MDEVDYIKWYEVQVYQRVWKAQLRVVNRWPGPEIYCGSSQEFGTMVSVTDLESEMTEHNIWEFLINNADRQMDEAIAEWSGSSAVVRGPREWTCHPFMQSSWDYMIRKGLVEEQE